MSSQPETDVRNAPLSSRLGGIIEQCYVGLHRYLIRRLRNPEDAKDLAQETWLRLCKASSKTTIREPEHYLFRSAEAVIGDWAQDRNSQECDPSSDIASEALADRPEDMLELTQFLEEALKKLPLQQAALVLLFYRDGLSRKEVAEKLGLTPDTVKKYLTLNCTRLRREFCELGKKS